MITRYDEEIVPGANALWSTQSANIQGFHAILFQDQPTIVFTDDTDHASRVIWRLPNSTWFDSGNPGLGYFGTANYPCTLAILLNRLYLFCYTGSNTTIVYASHSGNVSDSWLVHTKFDVTDAGERE